MILRLFEKDKHVMADKNYLELSTLIDSEMSPGRVFGMNRVDIIDVLEEMISEGYPMEVVRTNNIDTLIVNSTSFSELYLSGVFEKWGSTK